MRTITLHAFLKGRKTAISIPGSDASGEVLRGPSFDAGTGTKKFSKRGDFLYFVFNINKF
jgi:hypothetical protein